MEELVDYLQSNAKDIDGTSMVTLAAALQAVQTASSLNLLASLTSLEHSASEILQSLDQSLEDFEIEE